MNRVTLTMSILDLLSLVDPTIESVKEVQDRIKRIAEKDLDGKTRRPVGRPLQANHPHHTQEELKKFRDILFAEERIGSDPNWIFDGKKPTRLAADQDDMEPDEVRLDNGQVACMNSDLEGGIPPGQKYENPKPSWAWY
jgi:hypothetical protein